jgi:hypothetical protein
MIFKRQVNRMPPNQLIAMAGRNSLTVVLARLHAPGTLPPAPPIQTADGKWLERSAFYAGDGVLIDYANVKWTNNDRTSFVLTTFPGDSQQYETVDNDESARIVASAVVFDSLSASIGDISATRRVVSASVLGDVLSGKFNTKLNTLAAECIQTQRDLLTMSTALDATQVSNRRLASALQIIKINLQKTVGAIQQARESITGNVLAICSIQVAALHSEIHANVERLNAYMSDAFRVEQDANVLKRLFSCQAVPFTSPLVSKIQERVDSYHFTSIDCAKNKDLFAATDRGWVAVKHAFRQSQEQLHSPDMQEQMNQLSTMQVSSIDQRRQSNVQTMEQLKVDMATLSAKVSYYESTFAAAVCNTRVMTIYLRLYDACQRVMRAKAAYDTYYGSMHLLEWRRAFQELRLEETKWRFKKSDWNNTTKRLMFHVMTIYDACDAFREYTDEISRLLCSIASVDTCVKEFNDRVRLFMVSKKTQMDAIAKLAAHLELYRTEMHNLSDLVSAHAHDMSHVQLVHDYTEHMQAPVDLYWVRSVNLTVVTFSVKLLRQLQRDVMQTLANKNTFDSGRITEVDVVASCTTKLLPINTVSWGEFAYICRQHHEVLRTVERSSFRPEIMVAMFPHVEFVNRRTQRLRTILNGHVRQHANKVRSFLYETSETTVECKTTTHHIRSLCEHAMKLVHICTHAHVIDTYLPLVRIPLNDAMSVLGLYHDAITDANRAHQRWWDQWFAHMTQKLAVCRDNYKQLQSHNTMLHNKHAQSMQQFYMTKQLISDKTAQLKHKRSRLDQLKQRIDEALLIQHELGGSPQTHLITSDASGLCGVDAHEVGDHLYKEKAEMQLQCSVLANEIDELKQTIHDRQTTDDDGELHRTIAQCSEVSLRLRSMQLQINDEVARNKHTTFLSRETIRHLRSEIMRPDHLCRPFVCGTLRTTVQNPLFNYHRTLCKVHVSICQVKYLKHVSLVVNAMQWVDSENTFWKNAPTLLPFAPFDKDNAKCEKSQLAATNSFDHVAVIHLYLPVAIERPLHTIRSLVLDVSVSMCFHDVVSQQTRTVTSRHVTSTGVCVKPSFGRPPTSLFKPASAIFLGMMLHFIVKRRVDE